ncbi:hypothetical protein [Agromyces badenianii]|uniref:hypothetical protein n=1 Tax=Agromyces badenianii TaxID=2080742 RepID=UPI0011B233DF|nr:hypothetical protein [Agromyces badenianii]
MKTTHLEAGRLAALAVIAASVLTLLPTTPAAATDSSESCWYDVDTDEIGCFDASLDPHEQIELATGAELVAVPTGSNGGRSSADSSTIATVYLLATVWDSTSYAGQSMSYYTSNANICAGVAHGFPDLLSWKDRIESLQSYNGCVTWLYDDFGTLGLEYGPVSSSTNLGTFNNEARSMYIE